MDQLFLINDKKGLDELPSAKLKKSERKGRSSWTDFYAAYSEDFASSALEVLAVEEGELVFDPFVGSGTSAICAHKIRASFIGWDLDPFACLLSRAKVATLADPVKVRNFLKDGVGNSKISFDSQAYEIFDQSCLTYASTVFARIKRKVRGGKKLFLNNICSDSNRDYDSEVIALVSLCIAASRAAKLIKGSNPTWYRRGADGEFDFVGKLKSEAAIVSELLLSDLSHVQPQGITPFKVYNCDASGDGESVEDGSVDCVITSPPYLTRIDYVVNHLPNLILLSGLMGLDVGSLRSKMIGTSKVLDKSELDVQWGDTCIKVLNAINAHGSYASQRYYYWTYVQYFRSMYRALANIERKLKRGGRGLMVVQSSFYKELHVPLSEIIIEMLRGRGVDAKLVKKDAVKINMRSLQVGRSVDAQGRAQVSEDVIFFTK